MTSVFLMEFSSFCRTINVRFSYDSAFKPFQISLYFCPHPSPKLLSTPMTWSFPISILLPSPHSMDLPDTCNCPLCLSSWIPCWQNKLHVSESGNRDTRRAQMAGKDTDTINGVWCTTCTPSTVKPEQNWWYWVLWGVSHWWVGQQSRSHVRGMMPKRRCLRQKAQLP